MTVHMSLRHSISLIELHLFAFFEWCIFFLLRKLFYIICASSLEFLEIFFHFRHRDFTTCNLRGPMVYWCIRSQIDFWISYSMINLTFYFACSCHSSVTRYVFMAFNIIFMQLTTLTSSAFRSDLSFLGQASFHLFTHSPKEAVSNNELVYLFRETLSRQSFVSYLIGYDSVFTRDGKVHMWMWMFYNSHPLLI